MSIRKYWLLEYRFNDGVVMYVSDIEGTIALTSEPKAAREFDSKDDAETYLGMLHQEYEDLHGILNLCEATSHGFN